MASMSDKINTKVELDFDQRARACRLEDSVNDDAYATAAEIIFLRDRVKELEEITGPLIGEQRA